MGLEAAATLVLDVNPQQALDGITLIESALKGIGLTQVPLNTTEASQKAKTLAADYVSLTAKVEALEKQLQVSTAGLLKFSASSNGIGKTFTVAAKEVGSLTTSLERFKTEATAMASRGVDFSQLVKGTKLAQMATEENVRGLSAYIKKIEEVKVVLDRSGSPATVMKQYGDGAVEAVGKLDLLKVKLLELKAVSAATSTPAVTRATAAASIANAQANVNARNPSFSDDYVAESRAAQNLLRLKQETRAQLAVEAQHQLNDTKLANAAAKAEALAAVEVKKTLAATTNALTPAHLNGAAAAQTHAKSTRLFTDAQINAHSAARGLSGSLGTLWMTYGAIVPLLAGAALGAGFKAAATAGSEFAYQLTFVKALGGESAASVAKIGESALALSKTSLYGPVELANGLRMLSQAGLGAADAMQALPTALQLATVGEMSMEQASLTLIGVMNAFSMTLGDLPHIGDMFAKAAAVSQTSVSAMADAMKTASVVHDQYGASIEDTATALTLLAKVNITGTAAGTAYRNMLKDIYTPSKEAAKVMKQLGVETKDAAGNLREPMEVLSDLKTQLQKYTQGSQTDIIGKIFSERGGKEAIQMLGAVGTKWTELKTKISSSDGFMSGVTAELEMTTQGRFKQALNTMSTNLIGAFNASEGSVRTLADSLRKLADSPEFVAGINAIVGVMAKLATVLVDMLPAIAGFGVAWATFKTIGLAVSGIEAAAGAIAGLGAASGVAAGAAGVGGLGAAIALMSNPITWVVAGLGALALAAYNLKEGTPAGIVQVQNFNAVLDRQILKLQEANAEMVKKNRLQNTGSEIDRDTANQNLAKLRKERSELEAQVSSRSNPKDLSELNRNEALNVKDELALRRNKDAEIEALQKISALEKEQAKFDSLTLSGYVGQAKAGLRDLQEDAERAKKSINTSMISAVIGQMDAGGLDAEGTRKARKQLENFMASARRELLGSGTEIYAGVPKANGASASDHYNSEITKLKGYIQEYESEYAQFVSETGQMQATGEVSELQALQRNWAKKQEILDKELGVREQLVVKANTATGYEQANNDYQKLLGAQTLAYDEFNRKQAEAKRKTNDDILALDVQLGGKLETERDKALTVMQGQYAKMMQSALLNEDAASVEALKKIGNAFIQAADIKDAAAKINGGLAGISVGLTNLGSDVDKLEADMERDGGWISRIFNSAEISTLISEKLPAIRDEIARLKAELAALPVGSENSKEALGLQEKLAKEEKALNKFGNYTAKVWKDVVKGLDSTFHEGFAKIFSKGKTDWASFGKSLASSFKTTVVDAIYQMFARPMTMTVLASVAGSAGISGLANATDGGSSGSNLLGLGNSAYNAYSGGTGGLYGAFANSGVGSALGLSTMGASTGVMASTSMGLTIPGMATSSLTTLGSTIGAAIPWVGVALAVGSLFLKAGGGPKTEGNAYGTIGSDGTTSILHNASFAAPYGDGNWGRPGADASTVEAMLKPVGQSISEYITKLGGNASGLGIALGYNSDPKGKAPDGVMAGVYDASGKAIYSTVYDVEKGKASEAMTLELQKISVAAIQAAEGIKPIFKEIASGIDLTSATAAQLTQTLSDVQSAVALREAFKNINLDADTLSMSLITAAGGISNLSTNLNSYYQSYFTEAERTLKLSDKVADAFVAMHIAMPNSIAGFRSIVEGLDKTTLEGQATFAALMNVQGAFAQVTNAADATAAAATQAAAQAQAAASEQAAAVAKASIEKANSIQEAQADRIVSFLSAQKSAQQAIIDAKRAAELESISSQKSAYSDQLSASKAIASEFAGIVESLSKYRDSLLAGSQSTLSPLEKYAAAKSKFDLTAAKAKLGDKDAAGQLQSAVSDFLAASKETSASAASYAVDFGTTLSSLDAVIGTSGRQVSIAEQAVNIAQAQLDMLTSMASSMSSSTGSTTVADAADSLPLVVKDFAKAAEEWAYWFNNVSVGQTVVAGAGGSATRISQDKGIYTDLAGSSYAFSQADGPYALADQSKAFAKYMKDKFGIAALPGFAKGTNYVPQDMDVRVHQGEAILPKAYNPAAGGNDALIAALLAVKAEVAELRAEQRTGNANSKRTADTLISVTRGGSAMLTEAA